MENIGSLNVFMVAAETRSFARAGEALGISSSAVGKAMARLEKRLGVRLFHRSTRSIAITAEGTMFLDRCRRIFSEIEAAEQELSHTLAAPRGRLRVSLPLAGMLFMPAITKFMHAFPEVSIDLDFTDRLVDVIEEGFDAVVRTGEPADSRLMTRTLGKFSHRIVGSKDYFARFGLPEKPQDLSAHICLHHKYPSSGKLESWPLRQQPGERKVELPVSSSASTLEPLVAMAEQGLGLACLPLFTIRKQIAEGRLVAVLADHIEDVGEFRILWPSSRHLSPKIQAFVKFMSENLFRS
ncbi:LysR family transcriptional regulator [Pararhizobium sp. BT-229]|uniref:LysR family transcriptional regulator n=1 Tax=Pararhizobium sp. BT-229 TaxID=2986923 RepID=UPI0021F70F1A|nr:LysR family transcriptional regulator [Pararhizobium sp. BT-229]MCV9962516.1 LysR family transcriptional regulator [Pararhizobium sp. BT-229]